MCNYNYILGIFLIINNNVTPRGLHVARGIVFYFYFLSQYATISFYSTIESFTSATDNGKAIASSSCIASFDFSGFFFGVRRVSERCICALMLKKILCLC